MKVHYTTYGCKVNYCDTEAIAALMKDLGFERTDDLAGADIEILNSCTVTENANKRVRAALRQAKRANPEIITVLCGCYSQVYHKEASAIEQADIVTGNASREDIPKLISDYLEKDSKVFSHLPHVKGETFELLPQGKETDHTRAFLKVEDGCNRFCRYCIIPYARGPIRSINLAEIVARSRMLRESGYKEIVLTGINLAMTGTDRGYTIADAVKAVSDSGVDRIRVSSLEPDLITEPVMAELSGIRGFCPQFHMSLQSGCDRTLRNMGRRYTSSEYSGIVDKVRSYFDDPTFTTDVIVGYPGESEEDFIDSLRFVEKLGFLKVHVFPYSQRPGTPAAVMDGQIPKNIKSLRVTTLSEACEVSRSAIISSYIGKEVSILTEQLKKGWWHGYTERYIPVRIKASENITQNMIITAKGSHVEGGVLVLE
ncbi:MAG: tRNA (N(6)-L-threonylcarbamoyladenosine(37)-C(2))-methylthiotransferase MtaB [Oscillospiraceae bacterium]|nr:tRNA (N(6)-L-threonylcarbamoyladenosine(37)-C(2))-methylthiotransferase MtaB [Oscillospiraceae bacterium]